MKTWRYTGVCCDSADDYRARIGSLRRALEEADRVVVGAGAGLSAAAGLAYGGRRFRENFADFAERYGIVDMYSAMFHPFGSEEERWAYQSRHVRLNRFDNAMATPLYRLLLRLVGGKDYFVVTTNVDGLFRKSGFDADRLFEVQGDYGLIQCAGGCHDGLYGDEGMVRRMCAAARECRVPTEMVPRCPVCGGPMEIHVRKDMCFVEDGAWRARLESYLSFMGRAEAGRTLLLELGVGFSTPTIIRFPFERMASGREGVTLARVNRECGLSVGDVGRFIAFEEEMGRVMGDAAGGGSALDLVDSDDLV